MDTSVLNTICSYGEVVVYVDGVWTNEKGYHPPFTLLFVRVPMRYLIALECPRIPLAMDILL